MNLQNPPLEAVRELLVSARNVAVVGCSPDPTRTSHRIAAFLQESGYRMIPVHPSGGTILGEQTYPDLDAIPADIGIDVVDVFRRPDAVVPVAEAAVRRRARALWLQLGVVNEQAHAIASAAGLLVVMDACISVMHHRLVRG